MNSKLIKELNNLNESVNHASEHTQRQITNVDTSSLITIVVSLLVGLGLSIWLQIAVYWIPASFLIMTLWGIKGFFTSKKSFNKEKIDYALTVKEKITKEQMSHGIDWFLKNITNFAIATAIVYSITFFIILAIQQEWIHYPYYFNFTIPLIACVLYLPTPFLLKKTKHNLEKIMSFSFGFLSEKKEKQPNAFLKFLRVLKGFFVVFYFLGILTLPIWSLIKTFGLVDDWLLFTLVVILQIFILMVLSSYFSGLNVKRELANSLTHFADLNHRINMFILKDECTEEDIKILKKLYATAKPFDYMVDDSFKFINIYYLTINQVYINSISSKNE